jgi:hypothetical protein
MKLKNISKSISNFDYGELALLSIILIKTLKGAIDMNFNKINKPKLFVTTIVALNIGWIYADILNFKIYSISSFVVDIIACVFFLYYLFLIKIKKTNDFKNYRNIGISSTIYSIYVFVETVNGADDVSFKLFLASFISALIFGFIGAVLFSYTYTEDKN